MRPRSKGMPDNGARRTERPVPPSGYRLPAARAKAFAVAGTKRSEGVIAPLPFASLLSPSATNYLGGMRALQDLPAVLTVGQTEALRDVLAAPYDPRMAVSVLEFNGVKNAAAEFLLQQPGFPPDLVYDFAAMFGDPSYDIVWRDYCLQMLVTGYLGLAEREGREASEARSLALAVLLETAETHEHTWPGTALLGLHAIRSSAPAAVPPGEFERRVVAVASDETASEAARITALRLAGTCRVQEVRETARGLSLTGSTETLRAAAAATLGDMGEASDRALLADLAEAGNPFVSAAARRACDQLARRAGAAGGGL